MPQKSKTLVPLIFGILVLSCLVLTVVPRCGRQAIPTLTANPERKDGTAVYLLLDVSGSMGDSVRNAEGRNEPKIAIAKRAAIEVCNTVAKYADEDKTRNIQMGVASFSDDFSVSCPMARPDRASMTAAINRLSTRGGTAIGDAVANAQKTLDLTGLRSQHILILTDGENNSGVSPAAVAQAISNLPAELQPSVYVVAFDVNAAVFDGVKAQGWQVFSAANGSQLQQQLDEVVGGHILIEK